MVMVIWYYCLYQYKYIVTTLRRKVLREPPLLVGVQSKELPVTACVTCEGALFARTTLAAPPPPPPPLPPARTGTGGPGYPQARFSLAFTRYCFTSRLYCTIIFLQTPPLLIVQNIAQYYQLLHPPVRFWGVFERCLEVFGGVSLLFR